MMHRKPKSPEDSFLSERDEHEKSAKVQRIHRSRVKPQRYLIFGGLVALAMIVIVVDKLPYPWVLRTRGLDVIPIRGNDTEGPRPVSFPQDVSKALRRARKLLFNESYPLLLSEYGVKNMPMDIDEMVWNWKRYPFDKSFNKSIGIRHYYEINKNNPVIIRFIVSSPIIDSLELRERKGDDEYIALAWLDMENLQEKMVEIKTTKRKTSFELFLKKGVNPDVIFLRSTSEAGVAFGGPQFASDAYHMDFVDDYMFQLYGYDPSEEFYQKTWDEEISLGLFWVVPCQTETELSYGEMQEKLENARSLKPSLQRELDRYYEANKKEKKKEKKKSELDIVNSAITKLSRKDGDAEVSNDKIDNYAVINPTMTIRMILLEYGTATVLMETDGTPLYFDYYKDDCQGSGQLGVTEIAARLTIVGPHKHHFYCSVSLKPNSGSKYKIRFTIESTAPVVLMAPFDSDSTVLSYASGGSVYKARGMQGWQMMTRGGKAMHVVVETRAPPEKRIYESNITLT